MSDHLKLVVSNGSCPDADPVSTPVSRSKELDRYRMQVIAAEIWSGWLRGAFRRPEDVLLLLQFPVVRLGPGRLARLGAEIISAPLIVFVLFLARLVSFSLILMLMTPSSTTLLVLMLSTSTLSRWRILT